MYDNYLESIRKQFQYYKQLGEKTFEQLDEKELFWQPNEETNSVAIIVNHLWGNMMSRWSDFLTTDGEKAWRQRDLEFEHVIKSKNGLLEKWEKGWECLFTALTTIDKSNFDTTVYIRNQGHSIIEAVNRQLAHYAYHIGQIVLMGKMIRAEQWKSLSIPKGKSTEFNKEKFKQQKSKVHFTDELLNKTSNTNE